MCRSVRGPALILALAVLLAAGAIAVRPAPARAGLLGTLGSAGCKLIGTVGEGWWGDVCNGADKAVGVLGNLGGKAGKVAGVVSKVAGNPLVQRAAALAAIVAFVLGGAKWTMSHLATAIAQTTSPALTAAWFTTVYLKVEAVAWLLTIPFLVAAAVQAVFRAEPGMLARVVFIYLPLAAVGCALAVPITVLLLAGTDSLSGGLVHLAGQDGISFLSGTGAWVTAGLALIDPFVAVIAAMVIAVCGLALWTELIVRELAVYVVVAMLPLVFCAIVWPARRMWAIRTVEVLIALILSKLAIIVPLALGAAALSHDQSGGGAGRVLAGLALVGIGCLAPWLLLRLIPMAEVASAAVGHVRGQMHAHTGVRTPEAALARKITRHANDLADGVDVPELLRAMDRRAQQAQPTEPSQTAGADSVAAEPPPAPASARPSLFDQPAEDRPQTTPPSGPRSPTPVASPPAAGGPNLQGSAEPPTMVQQADGSWQPLRTGEDDARVPPPPWEPEEPTPDVAEPDPRFPDPDGEDGER